MFFFEKNKLPYFIIQISSFVAGIYLIRYGLPYTLHPDESYIFKDAIKNAYNYARNGGATVIEEINLSPNILLSEINRVMDDKNLMKKMQDGAKSFIKTDAADLIAREIIRIGLQHEK